MDEVKKVFYEKQANGIIKKLADRKMQGFYCPDSASASRKILELIGEGKKSIAYGGSMTIGRMGVREKIAAAGHDLIVREDYKTPEEQKVCRALTINADTFLMSTNAITLDGELVNIDGAGSRLAYLIYGPEQVIVAAGMNKVVATVEEGIERIHHLAAPANTVRLGCNTPCAVTGRCAGCLAHTICCQTVITRSSQVPGRIKVVLIGEELGY